VGKAISGLGVTMAKLKALLRKLKLRKLSWIDAVELLILCMIPVIAAPYYGKLLFFPTKEMPDQSNILQQIEKITQARKVDVTIACANGNSLNGWLFKLPNSRKVFLVSHGNAGNIANRILTAFMLLKAGGSVLLYDYEGYGLSTGEPSVSAIKADGQSAYNYLLNDQHYQAADIVDYGESIGAAVAVDIAKHNPVCCLIIQSGFTSLSDAMKDKLIFMRLYPPYVFSYVELDNLAYLRGHHPPLLLIHGDNDTTLPIKYAEKNFAEASEPKRLVVIKGAGHDDVSIRDAKLFINSVAQFVH
jgi:fermentation-respiration switch protein FrsA (DUF1100 family)